MEGLEKSDGETGLEAKSQRGYVNHGHTLSLSRRRGLKFAILDMHKGPTNHNPHRVNDQHASQPTVDFTYCL